MKRCISICYVSNHRLKLWLFDFISFQLYSFFSALNRYSVSVPKIADDTGPGIRDRCISMAHSVLECTQCKFVERNLNKNTTGLRNFG